MLLVLGVHRSGTSTAARMLECLGAVPSTHLHEPLPNNPKGFFEDFDVQRFNEYDLFPALGRHWHDIAPVDWAVPGAEMMQSLEEKALGILGANFDTENPVSVLKDPRMGVLLPFWLGVLEKAGLEPKAVFAVRDPLSVARSLRERDGFSITHGAMLYASNWISTLESARGLESAFVSFDSIFEDARSVLRRVARDLRLPLPGDFAERVETFLSEYLDADLRHSRFGTGELETDADIPKPAVEIHRLLMNAVDARNPAKCFSSPVLTADWRSELAPLLKDHGRLVAEAGAILQEKTNLQNELAGLKDHLARAETTPGARMCQVERELPENQQERQRLQSRIDSECDRNKSLQNELVEVKKNRDEISMSLAAAEEERNRAVHNLQSAREEVERLARDNSKQKGELNEANSLLEKHCDEAREMRMALQTLENEAVAAHEELKELSQALRESERRNSVLSVRFASAESQIGDLANIARNAESELDRHRADLEQAESRNQGLSLILESTRASTSWRFTAPLRRLVDAFKKSPLGLASAMRDIRESGFFDSAYYLLAYPDVRDSGIDPLKHYILYGGHQGRNPSPLFHSTYYLDSNADVRISGVNPLLHYVRTGRNENRKPTPVFRPPAEPSPTESAQDREIRTIRESGFFDAEYYLQQNTDVQQAGMDPALHYCLHGWREGRNPSPFFDTRFYLRTYLDGDPAGENPLFHYISKGRANGHYASELHRTEGRRKRSNSAWSRLCARLRYARDIHDAVVARYGGRLPAVRRFFAKLFSEGPSGIPANFRAQVHFAKKLVSAKRQLLEPAVLDGGGDVPPRGALPATGRILFVGCDGLLAGSQVLLLNILKWLHAHTALDLKIILISGGGLLPEYSKYGPVVVWQDLAMQIPDENKRREHLKKILGNVDLVYGNTFVAATIYSELECLGAPFLSHIHELEKSIRAYARPETIESLRSLSSEFIACSPPVAENLRQNHGIPPGRIHTVNAFIESRPPLPKDAKTALRRELGFASDEFVVVGCGTIYWRKGVDLFVETAVRLKELLKGKSRFVWIGEHYWDLDPQSRALAPWKSIEAKLESNGLAGSVEFPGPKADARRYFAAADVFFLPSREDPFPLVCLEAAQCGTPIVCFDKAGGMPDFVADDAGMVVPHLDTAAAARALACLAEDAPLRVRLGDNAAGKLTRLHTDETAVPEILHICRSLMKTAPAVSVIVPVFNHGRFLARRLDSILSQSFQDFEIIVLDDASTDDSLAVAQRYAGHPKVRIASNSHNSGSAFRQWKKGLALAQGEFVWIAEGDDESDPRFLRSLLPFFRDPEVSLAYSDSTMIDENGTPIGDYTGYYGLLDSTHWTMDYLVPGAAEINFGLGVKNTIPNTSAALMRRKFIEPAFLENIAAMRYSGDWLFHVQMVKGRKVGFRSLPLNLHRKHASTLTHQFNRSGTQQQSLLDEAARVHEFVLANFTLTPSFRKKLAFYLGEQIEALFNGTPQSEHDNFYPVSKTLKAVDAALSGSKEDRKRFAFVTTGDTAHDGGSEQLWIQTALRLAAEGHHVAVVIKRWSPEPYFFAEFRKAGIEFAFKHRDPAKAMAVFAPDLVVINIGDQDEGIDWYRACRELGLSYCIVNHLTKEPKYWPLRPELLDDVREGNLGAEQVLFTSRNNRVLMEKRLGCAVPHAGIFHNPLYLDRTKDALPFPPLDGPVRLAMPSRLLNIHKGQNIAIEVFSMKKWRGRKIELHLYGNGPDESQLRDTAARLGLGNVFFHEPNWQLPNPDMESIWRDNHALLMTSFMEGMPLVLLNAMFYGRVPIVTDIGGHREVVEDGESGFLAAEPSAAAVDAAMENAWQRLAEWERIGRRARESMLRFAPADPVADLIEKLRMFATGVQSSR